MIKGYVRRGQWNRDQKLGGTRVSWVRNKEGEMSLVKEKGLPCLLPRGVGVGRDLGRRPKGGRETSADSELPFLASVPSGLAEAGLRAGGQHRSPPVGTAARDSSS